MWNEAGSDILPDHEAEDARDNFDILESESPMAVHELDTPADALKKEFESEFAHWPVHDRHGSTTTANRVLELLQMVSGGCCVVVAPRSRLQRLALRSTDQGYMSRRLKGIHVTEVAFAASLIEFASHTETDRWPEYYHDEEAAGQPKDGAIFVVPGGYCAKGAAMMLGLIPPTQWPGRGTRHISALAASAHLGNSIVFVRSDSGSVHVLLGKDQGIIVRHLRVEKGIEELSPGVLGASPSRIFLSAPVTYSPATFVTLLKMPNINESPLQALGVNDLAHLERCCRQFSLHRQARLIDERRLLVRRGTRFQDLVDFCGFSQNGNVVNAEGILYEVIHSPCPGFNYICLDEVRNNFRTEADFETRREIMIFYEAGTVSKIHESSMLMKSQRTGPGYVDLNRITFTCRCSALTGRQ